MGAATCADTVASMGPGLAAATVSRIALSHTFSTGTLGVGAVASRIGTRAFGLVCCAAARTIAIMAGSGEGEGTPSMAVAMMSLLIAIPLLGLTTGLRSMTPMALICWYAVLGYLPVDGTWAA